MPILHVLYGLQTCNDATVPHETEPFRYLEMENHKPLIANANIWSETIIRQFSCFQNCHSTQPSYILFLTIADIEPCVHLYCKPSIVYGICVLFTK